jgi:hypothetical protein
MIIRVSFVVLVSFGRLQLRESRSPNPATSVARARSLVPAVVGKPHRGTTPAKSRNVFIEELYHAFDKSFRRRRVCSAFRTKPAFDPYSSPLWWCGQQANTCKTCPEIRTECLSPQLPGFQPIPVRTISPFPHWTIKGFFPVAVPLQEMCKPNVATDQPRTLPIQRAAGKHNSSNITTRATPALPTCTWRGTALFQ